MKTNKLKKMKIIHAIPGIRRGGGNVYLNELITSRVMTDFIHYVISSQINDKTMMPSCETRIVNYNTILGFVRTFILILKIKPNIIHLHGRHCFIISLIGFFLNITVITQFHGYHYVDRKYKNVFERLTHKYIDYILSRISRFCIATCPEEAKKIKKLSKDINPKVIFTRIKEVGKRKPYQDASYEKKIYILSLQGIHQKGFDRMVSLISELKDTNYRFIHYMNTNNKNDLDYLQEKRTEMQLFNYEIKTSVSNVWANVRNDGFALLSCSRFEGLPLTIQEAFWNGVLVIATDCVGHNDLLTPERSCILPNDDENSWAKILRQCENTAPTKIDELVNHAHRYIRSIGNADAMHKEISELYLEAVS